MRILICFLIILNITPAFADFTTYTERNSIGNNFNSKLKMNQPKNIIVDHGYSRQNRIYQQQPQYRNYPYLSKKNLNILEKHALNRTFKGDNDLQRLERLENLAFGATQYGDLTSRYYNLENAILSRPQYNQKKSLLNNIANYFAGQATGLTPGLIPYSNLGGFSSNPYSFTTAPGYRNNSFEQYSNGIFGGGWGISGSDYGTRSSIKMID